jgi:glycosyltransferase involved in cell wall biosynthesis
MSIPKISIFMPVYNGGKYIETSIASVLQQTFDDFELVCVDDSSTDNSYNVLLGLANIDSRIKVYKKKHEGNVPSSWIFILPYLRGNFIQYMSQDDLMAKDLLEKCYNRYVETNADVIVPNMEYYYEDHIKNSVIKGLGDKIITGRDAFILSLFWKIHGFALWKTSLFKGTDFDKNVYNNDEYVTRLHFFCSKKVAFCDSWFYYRQDNKNAITKTSNKSYQIDSLETDYKILHILLYNKFEGKYIYQWMRMIRWKLWVYNKLIKENKTRWEYNEQSHAIQIEKKSIYLFNLLQYIKYDVRHDDYKGYIMILILKLSYYMH